MRLCAFIFALLICFTSPPPAHSATVTKAYHALNELISHPNPGTIEEITQRFTYMLYMSQILETCKRFSQDEYHTLIDYLNIELDALEVDDTKTLSKEIQQRAKKEYQRFFHGDKINSRCTMPELEQIDSMILLYLKLARALHPIPSQ